MYNPTGPGPNVPPPPPPVQFDQAEYLDQDTLNRRNKSTPCTACKKSITESYYEANGMVLCPACKADVHAAVTGGSKTFRMVKAFLFGVVTAVITSLLYYLLRKVTDAEFALATIAMGWLIGLAVHKGANGRGGLFYQAAAVILTYLAISFSYVPMMFEEMDEAAAEYEMLDEGAATGEEFSAAAAAETAMKPATDVTPAQAAVAAPAETAAESDLSAGTASSLEDSAYEDALPASTLIFALLGFIVSLPVLMCKSSPIMILIYGFGLWQAGKMNQRPVINVTGPYDVKNRSGIGF